MEIKCWQATGPEDNVPNTKTLVNEKVCKKMPVSAGKVHGPKSCSMFTISITSPVILCLIMISIIGSDISNMVP